MYVDNQLELFSVPWAWSPLVTERPKDKQLKVTRNVRTIQRLRFEVVAIWCYNLFRVKLRVLRSNGSRTSSWRLPAIARWSYTTSALSTTNWKSHWDASWCGHQQHRPWFVILIWLFGHKATTGHSVHARLVS